MDVSEIKIQCGEKETSVICRWRIPTGPFSVDFFRPSMRTLDRQLIEREDVYSKVCTNSNDKLSVTYYTSNSDLLEAYRPLALKWNFFIHWHAELATYLTLYHLDTLNDFVTITENGLTHTKGWYDEFDTDNPIRGYNDRDWVHCVYLLTAFARSEPERSYISQLRKEMRLHSGNLLETINACLPVMQNLYQSLLDWNPVLQQEKRLQDTAQKKRLTDAAKARGFPARFYASL